MPVKLAGLLLPLGLLLAFTARADLTILQKIEGTDPASEVTIKVRAGKVRVDASPQVATILDGKTGDMISLMKDQKTAVRMSADKMKAAAAMVNKFSDKEKTDQPVKLMPTGRKEKISGYDAEEYVYETPDLKASYWIAPGYPDGKTILKEMEALKSEAWSENHSKMPDYSDFAGIPLRTVISSNGTQITSTIISIKRDSLNDADFVIPKDFQEIKTPEINVSPPEDAKKPQPAPSPGS